MLIATNSIANTKVGRNATSLQAKLDAFKADFGQVNRPTTCPVSWSRPCTARPPSRSSPVPPRVPSGRATRPLASCLNDANGNPVAASALLEQGPLVIRFYRGVWCPYCTMELQALQEALPASRAAGAHLVAISP
jgi:alkyl hydroperoxide reductase subunit AhpC